MYKSIKFFAVVMMMFSISCSTEPITEDINASQDNENITRSSNERQDVIARASGDVVGTAILHRKKNRISMNMHTEGLTPGDAYTVWFIIFEAPDVFVDALYGSGGVIDSDGVGNFTGSLNEGDISGSIATEVGLTDAEHQGVHMVIRSHGQAIPGIVYEQTTTLNGGCDPGPNVCTDEADVIFLPL